MSIQDLETNFLVNRNDIGYNKAETIGEKLREMKRDTDVDVYAGDINLDVIEMHNIVIMNDFDIDFISNVDSICRDQNPPIGFVYVDI